MATENRLITLDDLRRMVDSLAAQAQPVLPLYLAVYNPDPTQHGALGPNIGEWVHRIDIRHGEAYIELIPPPIVPPYPAHVPLEFRIAYGSITATLYGYLKYLSQEQS